MTQKEPVHPVQPVVADERGVLRFKRNEIVRRLLDENGKIDMNTIAVWDVPREDREQFAQLIGYSLSGAADLGYMSDAVLCAAEAPGTNEDKEQYRAGYADGRASAFERLREVIAEAEESYV